jgi:mRNA-degrading endonuclease RelE of RelBE toxin-antitoxin system
MLTVIETPEFLAWYGKVWSDDERDKFVAWIADHPEAGDVIPHTGGLRKVRWSRAGMGKRGGSRVIYYLHRAGGHIVLLLAYAKAKFDDLRPEFLKMLKERNDVRIKLASRS